MSIITSTTWRHSCARLPLATDWATMETGRAQPTGFPMTHTADKSGNTSTFRILAVVLAVVVLAVLAVVLFGLPVLGLLGLVLTVAVFTVMLLFTAGN